jgi:hypothetical protein
MDKYFDSFEHFDTITIAYGAGSELSQVLPYTDEFINNHHNKRNLILSFDKFDEGEGFGRFDDYKMNSICSYIKNKTKYKSISPLNNDGEIKKIINIDEIFDLLFSKMLDSATTNDEKYKTIAENINTLTNLNGNTEDSGNKNNRKTTYITLCNAMKIEIEKTKRIINNCNVDDEDILHRLNFESESKVDNNYKSKITTEFEKIFKLKCKVDEKSNDETIYELRIINSNLYLNNIARMINMFKNKNKQINIICSIRKVDCICNYLNLEDLLVHVDNLYIAHGKQDVGYIVSFTGKYLNDTRKKIEILNKNKTGINHEFEEKIKSNTKYEY